MEEDKLNEFEQIQYLRARLKGRIGFTYVVGISMFIIGFLIARIIYNGI